MLSRGVLYACQGKNAIFTQSYENKSEAYLLRSEASVNILTHVFVERELK